MRELVGGKNTIDRTAAVLKKPHKATFNLFYAQYDSSAAERSSGNKTVPTSQAKSTKHPISPHSTEHWQRVNRKRYRKTEDHDYPTAKKTDYWLGEAVPTSNRFSSLEEEIPTDDHTHSTDPKPPQILISAVTNIKPLIELQNALAPNKYLVKTLPHDQVTVQPTESSIYTAIIKALMNRNTEFHTCKPREGRSFRVVLKNLLPSTDVNDIKQTLKEEGHEATNIWNVKRRDTNIWNVKQRDTNIWNVKHSDSNIGNVKQRDTNIRNVKQRGTNIRNVKQRDTNIWNVKQRDTNIWNVNMTSSQVNYSKNCPGRVSERSHRCLKRPSDLNTSPVIGK